MSTFDVVAVVSQKGGAGKTTLALALAVAAHRDGRSVLLVDVDPQATAAAWSDRRDGPPVVVSAQAARLASVLSDARGQGVDLVVIDTPPRVELAALTAAKAAQLVLTPCRPAVFDLETVVTTLQLVRVAATAQIVAVLNGVPARGQKQQQAAETLESFGVPVCPVPFGNRTAFSDSAITGQTAQEHDPHGKAAGEIQGVYKFVCLQLNKTRN